MSNQAKFLVSLLFIAIIILCTGLTRFYFDATKNTYGNDQQESIAKLLKKYDNGMQVFESKNGYHGLLDQEGAVIIEPEWMEILTVTDRMALVSRRIQDQVLIGGVDFEENIIFPFMFRSMQPIADHYYIGTVAEDESCIVYNEKFEPLFQNSWNKTDYKNDLLLLEKDNCSFTYYIAEESPIFRKAQMICPIGTQSLTWNITNRVYLSTLRPEDYIRINSCVSSYMDMLISNEFEQLSSVSTDEYIGGLRKSDLFKGMIFDEITDFSFMAERGEDKLYKFSFSILYHKDPSVQEETNSSENEPEIAENNDLEGTAQVKLYFKKNSSNQLILTSMNLDYHHAQVYDPAS